VFAVDHVSLNKFKQFIGKFYVRKYHLKRAKHAESRQNNMRAFGIAVIGICAALYAVIGLLTSFGLSLGGVAFWPAAVIPAVFAVLYGPWVGGIGASIGIFIRDMVFHGNPLLSLAAGVTGNFAAFFLIGYLSQTHLDTRKLGLSVAFGLVAIVGGLLLPTLLLPAESTTFTKLSFTETLTLFIALAAATLVAIAVVTVRWREWRNFTTAAFIGQGVGAAVLTLGLWAYSQLFFSPTGYIKEAIPAAFVPVIFVWTFVTEIPFVLLLGPPIVKAGYKAFPTLRLKEKTGAKAT
jgi:uncharacterized membrane protein